MMDAANGEMLLSLVMEAEWSMRALCCRGPFSETLWELLVMLLEIVMNPSLPIRLVLLDLLGLHVSQLTHANPEVSPSKQAYPFVAGATVSKNRTCNHISMQSIVMFRMLVSNDTAAASPLSQCLKDLVQQEVKQFGAWIRSFVTFDPLREFFAGSVATLIRSSSV